MEVDALLGAQNWTCVLHRDGQLSLRECSADVSRHVIWPLIRVAVSPCHAIRHQRMEEVVEIGANVRRGILLYQQ